MARQELKACARLTPGASCVPFAKQKDEHKKHVVEMQEARDILESPHTHMENLLEISRFKNYSPISYQRY
jgi:hypothetical protein